MVAQVEDALHPPVLQVGDDLLEGREVAVDVGEQGDFLHRSSQKNEEHANGRRKSRTRLAYNIYRKLQLIARNNCANSKSLERRLDL